MTELSNEEKASERIAFVKRNCIMCKGRSRLRPVDEEIAKTRNGLKNLVDFFQEQFNDLRRKDADAVAINNALENKRTCMDLIEECYSCDKGIDRVNRGLNRIK